MTCLRRWGNRDLYSKFRFQWIGLSIVLAVLLCLIGRKTLCLDPLPRVNQSRKYLRTFLCHRIPFCPFSSSPFLAKKDMHKSLSVPSGVDSVFRSCVTKREKWLEIHITVPSKMNKLRIWYLGRFPFSQNFRNFRFGGKWNTFRRFVPLENFQKKWKI